MLKSHSQCGQDLFVHALLPKLGGVFLDIGAWPFVDNSNSQALEQQMGWSGMMVDLLRDGAEKRRAPFIQADATKINWLAELKKFGLPSLIDYLSLDVDEYTTETLLGLPLDQLKFRVLTVEHDSYWLGPGPRDKNRATLKAAGYDLVCEDVLVDYPEGERNAFEDWWVAPELSRAAERFRSKGKLWSEIVA